MIDDYRLFAAVIEAGSLSAGGRQRGLSPAMASKRIARLEARLGTRLAHRTTRKLVPTAAGAQFHGQIREILRAIDRAEGQARGVAGAVSGVLRMSVPTAFGRLHIAPRLHRFLAACPHVTLDIDLSDALVDLAARRTDLAIRIAATFDDRLVVHRLVASRRVLCASPGYIAAHGTPETLDDLATHRLLAAADQLPWRLAGPAGSSHALEATSHVRTNSSELVRELTLSGVGIALRSLWEVAPALESGALVRVLPRWQGSTGVAIHAVHLPAPDALPAIHAMLAFLRAEFADAAW